MEKLKCYIYGAGMEYNRLKSYIGLYKNEIEIIGIVTTRKQNFSYMDGFPCITIDKINAGEYDYVIIAVRNWKEVGGILKEYGITEEKWIRSTVFYCPYFDLHEFLKLKKSRVSILSNFCLGGFVYKELGLKVLSPTINMFCLGEDYIEFLKHYKDYLSMDIQPYNEVNQEYIRGTLNRERFIPKGIIGSRIVWYFNHDDTPEDAIANWNRKRKEVNFDNIAAIMIIQSDEEAYRFEELDIDKKIGVYYRNLPLKSVVFCSEWEQNAKLRRQFDFNWPKYANRYMTNWNMLGRVDWIRFLNGKKYLRY